MLYKAKFGDHPLSLIFSWWEIFTGTNFRGNHILKNSAGTIFVNFTNGSLSENFARTNVREFRVAIISCYFTRTSFREFSRISWNSFFQGILQGTNFSRMAQFFFNFVGRKFCEFCEFSLFRENKFPRKFVPAKISQRENMRLR